MWCTCESASEFVMPIFIDTIRDECRKPYSKYNTSSSKTQHNHKYGKIHVYTYMYVYMLSAVATLMTRMSKPDRDRTALSNLYRVLIYTP